MVEDTQLHEAVRYEDIEEVRSLLESGHYDIDQIGMFQWTCLHEAAANGLQEILILLLRFGADANTQDLLKGYTALHYAAEQDDLQIVQDLVDHNARIDISSKDGQTPVDVAVGDSRDFLLRQAPLLMERQPTRPPDPPLLIHSISKLSQDSSGLYGSQSSDIGSTSDYDTNVGRVELSFEYNSKKGSLKIRVWSLFDLLMPPPNESPVSMLFLRAQVKKDKRHYFKTTTETVKAYPETLLKPSTTLSDEHVTFIATEATYHFEQPMHFPSITKEMIAEEDLEIFLYVRLRMSTKTFAVSQLKLPLKDAVRQLTKTVYSLKPISGVKLPSNVKLYGNASILRSVKSKAGWASTSNPSLRHARLNVFSVNDTARSASDSNLRSVRCIDPGSDQVSLEMSVVEEQNHTVLDNIPDFSLCSVSDDSHEPSIGESSLISVSVHRPQIVEPNVSTCSLDVPLISDESEEEDCLNEVVTGYDNPTFIGSVEYIMPPISKSSLTSDLRVHQPPKKFADYPSDEEIELIDLARYP